MTHGDGCYHLIKHNDGWWALVDDSAIGPFRSGWGAWMWARALTGGADAEREERKRSQSLTAAAGQC